MNEQLNKTNYEDYRDAKLSDPEFRVKYLLAKEKLELDLMIDEISACVKNSIKPELILNKLSTLSEHIHKLAL